MSIPKVIHSVVNSNLCIGCGVCVYACPSEALEMNWNNHGFLIPKLSGSCVSDGDCLAVCPFNPFPESQVRTENELADLFLAAKQKYHPKIGRFKAIYGGFSNQFRLSSSSGGIATYILTELLSKGIVNHVFSVKESQKAGSYYEYAISSSKNDLIQASKTRYVPVTLDGVLSILGSLDGRVAIVGVACFIKAVRLAQYKEPDLKEKIPFLVGIICGGVKSRFFTEYLGSKAGVKKENILDPRFRIKDFTSTAGDYSYGCKDKAANLERTIKMRSVGDMWGTGLFKANACDFCDDVTTELADISLGDAWLPPFNKDGRGTNVIVTRSEIAEELIQGGIQNGDLAIKDLPLDLFIASQQGGFNHRQMGLSVRIRQAERKKIIIPPKRFGSEKVPLDFNIVQKLRMRVRQKSLEIWNANSNAETFDKAIKGLLLQLKISTKVYHYRRTIAKQLGKLRNKLRNKL